MGGRGGGHAQNVLGLDDHAPARPDGAGGREGGVLREGEGLGWAPEVGDAGEDEGPLGCVRIPGSKRVGGGRVSGG